MKLTDYHFTNDYIKVYNLGDVHFGNRTCHRDKFYKMVEIIKNDDNAYWVSTGDLLEVAIFSSVSADYESMSLQKEFNMMIDALRPIAPKCLGLVGSNHHKRLEKATGLNLDQLIAEFLRIPYLGKVGYMRFKVQDIGYYASMFHGYGMGRTRGSKSNMLQMFGNVIKGFDLYMAGHTHCFDHFIDYVRMLDRKHKSIQNIITHYVITGHYIDWDDSYAAEKMLPPAPYGSSVCILQGGNTSSKKKISVDFEEV